MPAKIVRKTVGDSAETKELHKLDASAENLSQEKYENPNEKENQWAIKEIPSEYRFYNLSKPLEGKPLSWQEAKLLATINEDNANEVINEIIKRCIKGIDYRNILIQEKLFFVFWLRNQSYLDSTYTIKDCVCKECKHKHDFRFKVSDLAIKTAPKDLEDKMELLLPSGNKIVIRLFRIGDEEYATNYSKAHPEIEPDLVNISVVINSINGENRTLQEKIEFFNNRIGAIEDYSYIVQKISGIEFGIDNNISATCPACGGQTEEAVTFQPDFFIPVYQSL